MKKSTEQLFDAPWKRAQNLSRNGSGATRGFSPSRIVDASNNNVAYAYPTLPKGKQKITANRLARLPELYDALAEAVEEACQDCVDETLQRTGMLFEPVKDGCVYPERDCCPKCRSWIDLLRKVRNGE